MAGVIDEYVAALRRELDFDVKLAERIASEVEDHLRDAAEADPAGPSPDAERRAVERFGLGRDIAAQFAADSIDHQVRRTWITLAVTVIVTFVAMRLHVTWLDDGAVSALAPLIDRYAFIGALIVGLVGWFACRRSFAALTICLAGLVVSIAADIVRSGLFEGGAPLHVVLSAAAEIALIALLSRHVIGLGRRIKRTATARRAGR